MIATVFRLDNYIKKIKCTSFKDLACISCSLKLIKKKKRNEGDLYWRKNIFTEFLKENPWLTILENRSHKDFQHEKEHQTLIKLF